MGSASPGRRALAIALVAVAYALTGRLGLALEPAAGFATLVWPPSGIGLIAVLLGGRALAAGVALGAFAVNLAAGAPPAAAAAIAAGNTLEAALGAELLRRRGVDPSLARIRDAAFFLLFGAAVPTLVAAAIGSATLAAFGLTSEGERLRAGLAWWLGDAAGVLLVGATLAVWLSSPAGRTRRPVEAALALALTAAAALVVFGGWGETGRSPLMYVLFPPLLWTSARFGPRGATATVTLASATAIAATLAGRGPFAETDPLTSLFGLQSFMTVVAGACLLLGAAVAERDRALASSQEAVRARDEFVAIASHELKSPLSALLLSLGSLERRNGDPVAARAGRQARRLDGLVATLLDATRIDERSVVLSKDDVDLAALVRDVLDDLEPAAAAAKVELRPSIPDAVVGRWDRVRLGQIVGNLLSNAVRHAAGSPTDVVLKDLGEEVRLTVHDRGRGISVAEAARVFDRFERGGAKKERGGLGLGLHVARHLAEAHGGTLELEVRPDEKGARFLLRLPKRAPDRAPERDAS